jgi:uncharacterized protein (TIGR02246 family)
VTHDPNVEQSNLRTEDARSIARQYVNAVTTGDLDRLTALFAEDATFTMWGDLAGSGTTHGRQAIRDDFIARGAAAFVAGSIEIDVEKVIADDEHAVVQMTTRAELSAGGRYENHYCLVFTVRERRIAELSEYMDTAYAKRTLEPTATPGRGT